MAAVPDSSVQRNVQPDPASTSAAKTKFNLLDKLWFSPTRLKVARTAVLLFLVVTAILWYRQPRALLHPCFYAEDGKIFFKQQYELGFLPALVTRYAGYLLFAPRIVAGLCALLPIEYIPFAYAACSLLITAAILTFFFAPGFRAIIDSDSLRAGIVIFLALMPNAEPLMKLAYLNWYLLFFLALMTLFELPRNPLALWLLFVPAALTVWSTPVAIVCLPLVVLRAWQAVDLRERLWWTTLLLMLIAYPLLVERPPAMMNTMLQNHDGLVVLVRSIGYRIFCFFFFGQTITYPLLFPPNSWPWVMLLSVGLVLACGQAAVRACINDRRPGRVRWTPFWIFYLILGLPAMFVLRKEWWHFFLRWDINSWQGSGRYFYPSVLLLCVFFGVLYERLFRDWILAKTRRRELATVLLLIWTSAHVANLHLGAWDTQTTWSHYTEMINAAQARVSQTGKSEWVHVPTPAIGFDFDLRIIPASAKRKSL